MILPDGSAGYISSHYSGITSGRSTATPPKKSRLKHQLRKKQFIPSLYLFNAKLPPRRSWQGVRSQEVVVGGGGGVCLLPNSWIQHGNSAIVSGHKVVGGGSHRTVILPADSHRLPHTVPRPWKLRNTKTLCPEQLKTVMIHILTGIQYTLMSTTSLKTEQQNCAQDNTRTVMIHTLTGIQYTLMSMTSLKTAQNQNSYDTHTDSIQKQLWYTYWQVCTTHWQVQRPWKPCPGQPETVMIHTLIGYNTYSYDTHIDRVQYTHW